MAAPRQVPHRMERAAGQGSRPAIADARRGHHLDPRGLGGRGAGNLARGARAKAQLPGWRIVVSTTTDTGQKLARERFGADNVFYLPLDLPFAVHAYVEALRPKLLVLAESEFWPNLLHQAKRSGAAVAVVNARVSDRSLPGYLRCASCWCRVWRTWTCSWRRATKTRAGWSRSAHPPIAYISAAI